MARILRIEYLRLQGEHLPVEPAPANEWAPPCRRKLPASLQPHPVQTIASSINILANRSLQTEYTIKNMRIQLLLDCLGKPARAQSANAAHWQRMEHNALRQAGPFLGQNMYFMASLRQCLHQPLQIQLRAACCGKLPAYQGQFHAIEFGRFDTHGDSQRRPPAARIWRQTISRRKAKAGTTPASQKISIEQKPGIQREPVKTSRYNINFFLKRQMRQ
jgi:hypothetical protein